MYISTDILVMYTGTMVEKCTAGDLFLKPMHPYTKGLLSAIPIPNSDYRNKRVIMQGELSSPIEPQPGCRFAPRCQYCTGVCTERFPKYEEVEPNHFVACHNVMSINSL